MRIQREATARRSRNQRSADRRVRALLTRGLEHADKAVRAPGESSQDATRLRDGTAKTQKREEQLENTLRLCGVAPVR